MQLLITHGTVARTRVVSISRWQLLAGVAALGLMLMLASGAVYHFVFLKAAREGWPLAGPFVGLLVRDEIAQRERFMRDNLDAIAQKVGEMQAKLVKLEVMGERVVGLAGVKPEELRPLQRPVDAAHPSASAAAGGGRGGPYVPLDSPSLEQLHRVVEGLDVRAERHTDVFTLMESRLLQSRLDRLMVPSEPPLQGVPVGSGFGFRSDPFTGRTALHTGLDFAGEMGAPIRAAAGGIVTVKEWHPAYGHLLEIDHGNGLATRYAHTSAIEVEPGTLVRRGQRVARVGNSGRSTGPHLHFEVLVDGVPQDPARFLAGGEARRRPTAFAARLTPRAGARPTAVEAASDGPALPSQGRETP